jgi:hypothetical protein
MVIAMDEATLPSKQPSKALEGNHSKGSDKPLAIINSPPGLSIEQLVKERDHAVEECAILKGKFEELQTKMLEQEEANAELKRARQALNEEIFELTKALFEEANGMVASEARARAHIEAARHKLEGQLEMTKEQLRLEKQQLYELRGKFTKDKDVTIQPESKKSPFNKKEAVVTLLEKRKHHYFPILLPQLRFDSRRRCDGPAAGIWDEISQKLAEGELSEFSRFVERSSLLDVDGILGHPYMKRICETDVGPCLHFEFKPKPFVRKVVVAMLLNTCYVERVRRSDPEGGGHSRMSSEASNTSTVDLQIAAISMGGGFVEPIAMHHEARLQSPTGEQRLRGFVSHFTTSVSSLPEALLANIGSNGNGNGNGSGGTSSPNGQMVQDLPKFCALCGRSSVEDSTLLKYRVRFQDSEPWMLIDSSCRQRLVAVGHFFTFIRHVRCGLYSNRPLIDLYYDMLHFRRYMFYARVSVGAGHFFLQSDYEAYLDLIEGECKEREYEKLTRSKEDEPIAFPDAEIELLLGETETLEEPLEGLLEESSKEILIEETLDEPQIKIVLDERFSDGQSEPDAQ